MNDNGIKKDKDTKKITTLIILIVTLMVCETGATYAYFQINASSDNTLTGTAASGGIAFQTSVAGNAQGADGTPVLLYPTGTYATKPLVPQYAYRGTTNVLQKAVTGVKPTGASTVFPCVDANGNAICRVYTFWIRNNASSAVQVNGRIYFTSPTTNLKWALMTSGTAVTVSGTTSTANLRSPLTAANCTASTATSNKDCWFEVGDGESDGIVGRYLAPSGGVNVTGASGSYKQYWLVTWINETGAVQNDSGTWYATIEFSSSNGTGITSTITS